MLSLNWPGTSTWRRTPSQFATRPLHARRVRDERREDDAVELRPARRRAARSARRWRRDRSPRPPSSLRPSPRSRARRRPLRSSAIAGSLLRREILEQGAPHGSRPGSTSATARTARLTGTTTTRPDPSATGRRSPTRRRRRATTRKRRVRGACGLCATCHRQDTAPQRTPHRRADRARAR